MCDERPACGLPAQLAGDLYVVYRPGIASQGGIDPRSTGKGSRGYQAMTFPRLTTVKGDMTHKDSQPRVVSPELCGTETVLLVDDEDAVREVIQLSLELYDYTVLSARDSTEALAWCQRYQQPIHILLTDVMMPNTNGCQLAERIMVVLPNVRVLYMSGHSNSTLVQHGVVAQGRPFLPKPFTPQMLVSKVREVLGYRLPNSRN